MSDAAPTVLVDDLVVRFGELEAVGGVSFAISPGEVFGLLGPNGAGKTTTIRVLTTLLPPTEGRALVAGYDVRADPLAVRASIGYIPQAISVDGALTARENLDFYGRVTGVPRRERRERIEEVIGTMGLEPMIDRLARTLSGGMLQAPGDRHRAAEPPRGAVPRRADRRPRPDGAAARLGPPARRCASRPARRSSSRRT